MRRRLLANGIVAILALSLLSATSFALFTATTSITGNSITNGTVTMQVTDQNGAAVNAFGTGPSASSYYARSAGNAYALQNSLLPNNELNFAAADTTVRAFKLHNTGSLDHYVRFYLTNLKLVYTGGTVTDTTDPIFNNYKVYLFATNDFNGDLTSTELVPGYPSHLNNTQIDRITSFQTINGKDNAVGAVLNAHTKYADASGEHTVTSGEWAEYYLMVVLDKSAPNSLQSAKLTFDANFDAVQVANNPTSPNFDTSGQSFGGNYVMLTQTQLGKITWG